MESFTYLTRQPKLFCKETVDEIAGSTNEIEENIDCKGTNAIILQGITRASGSAATDL